MTGNPVEGPIRVEFTPTFDEYTELMHWARTRPPMVVGMTVMMVLVGLAFAVLYSPGGRPTWRLLQVPILPAVYFLFLRRIGRRIDRKRWEATAELRSPRTFTFSPNRVEVTAPGSSSEFGWTPIAAAYRTGGQYLLKTELGLVYAIPARAFAPGDLPRFEELVRSKVPTARL